jgi:hypothetical protein
MLFIVFGAFIEVLTLMNFKQGSSSFRSFSTPYPLLFLSLSLSLSLLAAVWLHDDE